VNQIHPRLSYDRVPSRPGVEARRAVDLDKPIDPNVQSVLNAAALLDVTEFDLFRLAYSRWHGEAASERIIEPFFVAYMFNEVVPLWVRHFARLVERLGRIGRLDRVALGVQNLPRTRQMVSRGMRFIATIVIALSVTIVLAEVAGRIMKLSERCFFPPCY
jgi:hypothetical protein